MREKNSELVKEMNWFENIPVRKKDSNVKTKPKQNTPPAK